MQTGLITEGYLAGRTISPTGALLPLPTDSKHWLESAAEWLDLAELPGTPTIEKARCHRRARIALDLARAIHAQDGERYDAAEAAFVAEAL